MKDAGSSCDSSPPAAPSQRGLLGDACLLGAAQVRLHLLLAEEVVLHTVTCLHLESAPDAVRSRRDADDADAAAARFVARELKEDLGRGADGSAKRGDAAHSLHSLLSPQGAFRLLRTTQTLRWEATARDLCTLLRDARESVRPPHCIRCPLVTGTPSDHCGPIAPC
jgi:hypothetical protein